MNETVRLKEQTGAAVVEFAVLLFLVLILLVGIFEFGFLWLQNNYIANAAREGARVAAKVGSSPDDVETAVKDYLKGIYPDDDVEDDCCGAGAFIEIQYDPDEIFPAGANGADVPYMRQVTVTVQTDRIWEPLLWDLLEIRPFRDTTADLNDISDISETAVFPMEDQTGPSES